MSIQTALTSLFDGSLYGEREQRIHTPPSVLRALELLWPTGIELDPCGSPDGIVKARRIVVPPENGLTINWPSCTYFNPPYDDMQPWLLKYMRTWECVGLVPNRSHRKWWRHAARESSQVVTLDPLQFIDSGKMYGTPTLYPAAFPAPLVLLYRGDSDLQSIAERVGLVDNDFGDAQTELVL